MKVLDGRNSHSVPKVIELSEFIVASKYVTTNNNNEVVSIYMTFCLTDSMSLVWQVVIHAINIYSARPIKPSAVL